MATPEQILKEYWGYDRFRPLQKEIIGSVLEGKDTLALLPTGGGKSVCYQVPALVQEGTCLVISPLIALMQDQVMRLKQLGINAASLHSGLNYNEVRRTLENTMHGAYKLLYVSPERLQTRLFSDYVGELDISLIAVDEAHCISQWGHDFRPDYLKIAQLREVFPRTPILAVTATATTEVQSDIEAQLKLRDAIVFRQSFSRENIFYTVRYSENKNGDTGQFIKDKCSIIYSRSRMQTEAIARHLNQTGVTAAQYHAGMAREKRDEAQEQWMHGDALVMSATTAFGMGIDKPDVRAVLHYDAPEHLEAYYQEAGRAGRDQLPSTALLLYNTADIERLIESTALHYPPEAYLRKVYQAVVEYLQVPAGAEPDRYYDFDLADLCRKFSLKANEAIHALKILEREGLWTLTESVYNPATVQFTADRHTLDRLPDVNPGLGYLAVGLLRMYNTIFHFPTPVRETAIARQLKLKKEEVVTMLQALEQMGILEYNKPGEGPQLFFHHYRVDSRHLIIDLQKIARLRERHEKRTKAMIGFLENRTVCRERVLLTYFGERVMKDCGHCDVCRDKNAPKADNAQLREDILRILKTEGKLAVADLLHRYPAAIKDVVVSLLRQMVDENILRVDADRNIQLL